MAEVRAVYRAFLQALRKNVAHSPESRSLRMHAASVFKQRANSAALSVEERKRAVLLANDYAFLANAVHEQQELLMSYNIGIDRTAEQAERLRSTADRVGLRLPQELDHSQYSQ